MEHPSGYYRLQENGKQGFLSNLKYHYLRNTFREVDLFKDTHAHTDSMVTSSTYTFA
jgi:hypothetical protein